MKIAGGSDRAGVVVGKPGNDGGGAGGDSGDD